MRTLRPCCKAYLTLAALAVFASFLFGTQGCGKDATTAMIDVAISQVLLPALNLDLAGLNQYMLDAGWEYPDGALKARLTDLPAVVVCAFKGAVIVLKGDGATVTPAQEKAVQQVTGAVNVADVKLKATLSAKALKVSSPPVPKAAQ